MTGIYLFALAAGLPLVIWSLLGGDHGDTSAHGGYEIGSGDLGTDFAGDFGGDLGGDMSTDGGLVHVGAHAGAQEGFGAIMMRLFPLSSISMFLSVFGLTGVAMTWLGNSMLVTLVSALALGLGAGALNSAIFSYLRKTESNTAVSDVAIMGATGHVVLPIGPARRGRVALNLHGQTVYLTAQLLEARNGLERLEIHDPILVVEVKHGIAIVVPIEENLT